MWHCLLVFIFQTKEMHSNLDTFDIKRVTEFIKITLQQKLIDNMLSLAGTIKPIG